MLDKFGLPVLPQLATTVASLSLACSVAYHLGYFLSIDARFIWFFSIQDAIINAISFVPLIVVGVIIGSIMRKARPPKASKIVDFFASRGGKADLLGLIIGLVIAFSFYQKSSSAVVMSSLFALPVLAGWAYRTTEGQENFEIMLELITVGWLIWMSFFTGSSFAQASLLDQRKEYSVELQGEAPFTADLLRSGSAYLLAQRQDNSVELIPQTRVVRISRPVHVRTPIASWIWTWITAKWLSSPRPVHHP